MENENQGRSLVGLTLRNLPQLVASAGVARAMDGNIDLTNSIGWWYAGWKAISAGIAFEALKFGKRDTSAGDALQTRIGSYFRGQRLFSYLAEIGLSGYALHEMLQGTIYRSSPDVDMRSVVYGTAGMYLISGLAKLRN